MSTISSRWSARCALHATLAGAAMVAATIAATPAAHAQPFDCTSPDPAMWPPPAKPYFMIAFDTSGSMGTAIATNNSCNYPNDRVGHGRCAIKNTVLAFSGQANFGLAIFARRIYNCTSATCFTNCQFQNLPNNSAADDCQGSAGCGYEPNPGAAFSSSRAGANILVPMLQDTSPPQATNVPEILSWVDNNCANSKEIFATGCTPLNGMLRDMYRYYSNQWVYPGGGLTYTSPLTSAANGERSCRSVNVIFVTDGDETCDQDADAVNAAAALYNGFTKDGITWRVRTFVIAFGGAVAGGNAIASAGGTGTAQVATDEAALSTALANIIAGATAPEVCNNADDNCNGCIDEGYKHYCNVQPVAANCCAWANAAQRTTCLTNYQSSINVGNPGGDLTLLPCTTPAQQQDPNQWLCYDPGERCDNVDNNCQADGAGVSVDEGVVKCGNPPHCPLTEVCNGLDDDCDGLVDEAVCNGCVPSAEICDGCDNDCDGVADEGINPIPCGLASPANCTGTLACNPPQNVPVGGCAPGGGYGTCTNNPQAEVCDGLDNNCDGLVDNNVAPVPCVPPGTPGGLVYGGNSQCQMGSQPCGGTCQGFIGPSQEVCDGIDNDCNGVVDDTAFGVGQLCGINQPPCSPGVTACVNGAIVCQGGTGPQPEVCDGIDNNCNGAVDDAPLADGPAAGQNGCWTNSGNCCVFPAPPNAPDITWCPPAGATCNGNGSLSPPCNKGTLVCQGGAWTCVNPKAPAPETCDGLDNDCNNAVDDGLGAPVGDVCGSDDGECQTGTIACNGGVLDCVGDVGPTPELCDGLDNDCDGTVDNGVQAGGPCTPPYDMMAYPGPRDNFPCVPGVLMCDPVNGPVCVGGVGPSPEICDGIDNDCDGSVDEMGPPPDGTDGTVSPQGEAIGDVCGVNVGVCSEGVIACLNGLFQCVGGQAPGPEQCDCLDNDCNGVSDNHNMNGPPLCGAGKDCVRSGDQCQCAGPCGDEFPCPPGQKCAQVTESETGIDLGFRCITDYDALCGDCATKTVTSMSGQVECAPAGTPGQNCVEPPVCVCRNQNGCHEPCFGVSCAQGLTCTSYGSNAGTCAVHDNNCWNFPCMGCDQACHQGSCVTNPCTADACPPDQACKPSADFSTFTCVGSCAGVTCPSGQACVDGQCQPTCSPVCAAGQVCDTTQDPPTCVANMCEPQNPCVDGSCCDPATGACGDCPCEGVVCPGDQVCRNGSCIGSGSGAGGSGGAGGGATTTGTGTTAASGAGGAGGEHGIFGLATGGGGCACEAGAGATRSGGQAALLLAAALGLSRRRRRARGSSRGEGEVAR